MIIQGTHITYPNWEADKEAADKLFVEFDSTKFYNLKLETMRNKQLLHDADRSHPDIMELDRIRFDYPGWQDDKQKAERRHVGDCSTIDLGGSGVRSILTMMKKKQAVYNGRSSIKCLKELDNFPFSYPNWQKDKKQAEMYYIAYASSVFNKKFEAMRLKQRIYDGDRSHPDVKTLDEMVLTYPGAEQDKVEALKRITGECSVLDLGGFSFHTLLSTMEKKQEAFDCSGNECTRVLSSLNLSYPGFNKDIDTAKQYYVDFSSLKPFKDKVTAMKNKERLFRNDRSHPDIAALDAIQFTYDGWEEDKAEAEQRHVGDCSLLVLGSLGYETIINKMKKRQQIHLEQTTTTTTSSETTKRNSNRLDLRTPASEMPFLRRCSTSSSCGTSLTDLMPSSSLSWEDSSVSEASNRKCVVCLENEPSHAFIPCGHRCVCSGCSADYGLKFSEGEVKCPLCREAAMCVTRIYT